MRRSLLLLAAAVLAGAVSAASAQTYPSRPVTMVVPFPPGGNTDLMARALQAELSKALSQSVIISNKGGAAGTIGLLDLVKAEPDGYTIALTPNNPVTAQPHMQPNLRFGMDTFRYICLTYYTPYVLIAGPQAPFKTFAEFVVFAKAKPENLVYGHPGVASQPHLVMLGVLKAVGVDGLGVPFQGAGPMSHALLGGTIMAITESPPVAKASNLPVLAAVSAERLASLPDVPTMKELGYPAIGFSAGGLIAPAKMPDAVASVLERACATAAAAPEYRAIVDRLGAEARYLPGDQFRAMFDADSVANAEAIKRAGLGAR
ncbi:MAG: tripartite tricarboxylate transporter substrate binding protein [Xanthobacteraceae bacterium]|nr:tripartite tricarboxylate transporter substrate binding protein [Xanthobacteraceae bacterium]